LHPSGRGARISINATRRGLRATKARNNHKEIDMHPVLKCLVGVVLLGSAVPLAVQAQVRTPDADWTTFYVPDFGTQIEYPAAIFSKDEGNAEKGLGRRFTTADGSATFTIYSRANEARDTPASYLRKNLRVSRTTLDYERIAPTFFAISSVRQGTIFYSRCNFSTDAGGAIHCFDLVYPQQAKRAYDYVVTRISRSLRPLESWQSAARGS
jgi:hypothetical protein